MVSIRPGTTIRATAPMFWDLRVSGLEAQALEPIESLEEMRGDAYGEANALKEVVARLVRIAEYRTLFRTAFGGSQPVTADNLGKALAAFQRSLLATNSPFDRYTRGDVSAMTSAQVRGMETFDRVGMRELPCRPDVFRLQAARAGSGRQRQGAQL